VLLRQTLIVSPLHLNVGHTDKVAANTRETLQPYHTFTFVKISLSISNGLSDCEGTKVVQSQSFNHFTFCRLTG